MPCEQTQKAKLAELQRTEHYKSIAEKIKERAYKGYRKCEYTMANLCLIN
jgi:hypothetical protein